MGSSIQCLVRLPPLIVNGEPKTLHGMTVKELKQFMTLMLSAVFDAHGNAVTFSYARYSRPAWWPCGIEWNATFDSNLTMNRGSLLRDIVFDCYTYYNQKETLRLFEPQLSNGILPFRIHIFGDGSYSIVSFYSNLPVWTFPHIYTATPLIALQSKQQLELEPSLYPVHRTRLQVFGSSNRQECPTPPPMKRFGLVHQPIYGYLNSSKHRNSKKDRIYPCRNCSSAFTTQTAFLYHEVSCSAKTRKQEEQSSFLLQLGLVPQESASYINTVCKKQAAVLRLHVIKLRESHSPVSFRVQQTIEDTECACQAFEGVVRDYVATYVKDSLSTCSQTRHNRRSQSRTTSSPTVPSPPPLSETLFDPVLAQTDSITAGNNTGAAWRKRSMISHFHTLKLTMCERRKHYRLIRHRGLNRTSYKLFRRICRPLRINLDRISVKQIKHKDLLDHFCRPCTVVVKKCSHR